MTVGVILDDIIHTSPYVCGWDQSINHAGAVLVNGKGIVVDYAFWTNKAKIAKADREHGTVLETTIQREADKAVLGVERLVAISAWIRDTLYRFFEYMAFGRKGSREEFLYIALEDYALRAAQGSHQLGEVGGIFKLCVREALRARLRLHDPTTVKMFATGDGSADKDAVREAVKEKWGASIPDWSVLKGDVEGDLYDAVALAMLAKREVELRTGLVILRDLLPEERRVFVRVTTSHPVNLLDRPWIGGEL